LLPAFKVYISSTQRDLVEERIAVKAALEKAGYDPLCMEKYPSFSSRPRTKCEDDVRMADIYVCIIGRNYGSLPEENGQTLPKSFTEYEYEAALSVTDRDMQVLVFVQHLNTEREDPKLLAFLKRLQDRHGTGTPFTNPDNLATQVLASITAAFNLSAKKQLTVNAKYYCDRAPQSDKFEDFFYTINSNRTVQFFLITGHEKNCHQSFVERCKCDFEQQDKKVLELHCDLEMNPPDNEEKIIKTIRTQLMRQLRPKIGAEVREFNAKILYDLLLRIREQYIIIYLFVQSSYIKPQYATMYRNGIEKFYKDFTSFDSSGLGEKKILFFLLLQHLDEAENDEVIRTTIEEDPFFDDKKLPRLNNLRKEDIKRWLRDSDIELNPTRQEALLRTHFEQLPPAGGGGFFMSDAEIAMETIIIEYAQKDLNT
jgi:Domain of unknown function (DUF4062)/inactive STAND